MGTGQPTGPHLESPTVTPDKGRISSVDDNTHTGDLASPNRMRIGRRDSTSISRQALNDHELSFKARGVLAWLLIWPEGEEVSACRETIAAHGTEGKEAIRTALQELTRAGYIVRRTTRRTDGRMATETWVFDTRQSPEPDNRSAVVPPVPDNRSAERAVDSQDFDSEAVEVVKSSPPKRYAVRTEAGECFIPSIAEIRANKAGYPHLFESAWSHYPRRSNNPKVAAYRAWHARIVEADKAGIPLHNRCWALERSAVGYAAYCSDEGLEERYIKHAATFWGPDEHWKAFVTQGQESADG